ncbi:translation initiation factor IF-1 [Candidatus Parcubacteria bacterium]|nr:translation initiation factor IF-1 [Candidatus Parcubacteria bacterium]
MGEEKSAEELVQGTVTEALPATLFRVKLGEDKELISYLSGKMRLHRIKVLVGDKVLVKLDPYGGKGRIVKRL